MLRYSLITVWFGTAFVSLLDWHGAGSGLLLRAGITSEWLIQTLIWAGSAADFVIGLLLCFKPGRMTYVITLAMLVFMTLIATCLMPTLWLDPLGPLLKNGPIAAIVLVLLNMEMEKTPCTAT